MKNFIICLLTCGLLIGTLYTCSYAQFTPYDGPDDPAGDIAAERTGFMTGNRVFLFFRNTTELSDHVHGVTTSKWPNNLEGTKMTDGIALLIGARVYVENGSTPVTDPGEIRTRTDLDTLYFCQSSYREFMDMDPSGTVEWGFYPVFGYFNELSETPAMSNRPDSWPPPGWPAYGNQLIWPGEWNGRFGRGIMKADQECYFVVNFTTALIFQQSLTMVEELAIINIHCMAELPGIELMMFLMIVRENIFISKITIQMKFGV